MSGQQFTLISLLALILVGPQGYLAMQYLEKNTNHMRNELEGLILNSGCQSARTRKILAYKFDLGRSNGNGYYPVHHLARSRVDTRACLKKMFNQNKISVNRKDNNGNTALMIAVKKGKFEFAKQLLLLGAFTDLQNHKGQGVDYFLDACHNCDLLALANFRHYLQWHRIAYQHAERIDDRLSISMQHHYRQRQRRYVDDQSYFKLNLSVFDLNNLYLVQQQQAQTIDCDKCKFSAANSDTVIYYRLTTNNEPAIILTRYNSHTGKALGTPIRIKHLNSKTNLRTYFSPKQHKLLLEQGNQSNGSGLSHLSLLSLDTGSTLWSIKQHGHFIRFDSSGDKIAFTNLGVRSTHKNLSLTILNAKTGKLLAQYHIPKVADYQQLDYSFKHNLVFVRYRPNKNTSVVLAAYSIKTKTWRYALPITSDRVNHASFTLPVHERYIVLSANDRRVGISLQLHNIESGKHITKLHYAFDRSKLNGMPRRLRAALFEATKQISTPVLSKSGRFIVAYACYPKLNTGVLVLWTRQSGKPAALFLHPNPSCQNYTMTLSEHQSYLRLRGHSSSADNQTGFSLIATPKAAPKHLRESPRKKREQRMRRGFCIGAGCKRTNIKHKID